MKKITTLLILAIIIFTGCSTPPVKKPNNLLPEDKVIDILVDSHIAEAAFNNRRHRDTLVAKSTSTDFYYSVLRKHEIQDTIFEKSLVYYASQPRQFEKIYRQVLNRLTEMEHELSGRKESMQELDVQRRR